MKINDMQEILEAFLIHIIDVHTDTYGHLEVCKEGDHLDPTVSRIVKDYINENLKDRVEL